MFPVTSCIGPICTVAPKLFAVVKRKYELGANQQLFKIDALEDGFSSSVAHPLSVIASLQLALQIPESKFEALFLSTEFENFTRKLIATQLIEEDVLPLLKKQLSSILLRFEVTNECAQLATLVDALLDVLTISALQMWRTAQEAGFMIQDEAATSINARLLNDELSALRAEISEGTLLTPSEYKKYESFIASYRNAVGGSFKYLTHPSFTETGPIRFDDLYVPANFVEIGRVTSERAQRVVKEQTVNSSETVLTPSEVLGISYRSVVLGNPGAGKSTFAAKLCHDLWMNPEDRIFGGRKLVPVLVVLRDYSKARKENPQSILEYVEQRSKTDYQVPPPDKAFHRIFLTGRAVIIFDGLDELMETADRLEIKRSVESFAELYPAVHMLVTSREVGYEQAPLDPLLFSVFRLLPFDQSQVEDYVRKWFTLSFSGTPDQRIERSKAFLRESAIIPDVRTNPLMLALLCNLYRQDGYLPRYRPDVYQRCADLLFDKWDKGRQISANIPVDYHLRPIMLHLANWIYVNNELQTGVTESDLVEETANYLDVFFEERPKALWYAHQIIEFFRGRAWVFSDTGSNQNERLYQFTHRTFLEFFAAEFIVGSSQGPVPLLDKLLPHIALREWDMVCLLACQMQAKRYKEGADDLLENLIVYAEANGDRNKKLTVILFCARLLVVIHPTLSLRKRVVDKALDALITEVMLRVTEEAASSAICEELGTVLVTLRDDSGTLLTASVSDYLSDVIKGESKEKAAAAHELLYSLPEFIDSPGRMLREELSNPLDWINAVREVSASVEAQRVALWPGNPRLALQSWRESDITIEQLLELFGLEIIFFASDVPFGHSYHLSIADSCRFRIVNALPPSHQREHTAEILDALLKEPLPWLENVDPDHTISMSVLASPKELTWPADIEERSLFVLLTAASFDLPRSSAPESPFTFLRKLLMARVNRVPAESVSDLLEHLDVLPTAADLLAKWSRREVSFTRSASRTEISASPDPAVGIPVPA